MRKIEFRGKNLYKDEWVYGVPVKTNGLSGICLIAELYHVDGSEYNAIEFDVVPETIGQLIELTDENNNKIFQGDILSCASPNDGEKYITTFTASLTNGITFENKSLMRELSMYGYDWPDEIKVIGNIHDNPELINNDR